MSPRTTAALAVVALLLGAFVWFYEIAGEPGRQAALDDAKRVTPGVEADAIDAIELVTKDAVPARFERREGRWWVAEPLEDLGDASALDAIAHALATLPREGEVSSDEGLDAFGLGERARVVRFDVDGEEKGLRIGRETPVGGNVYVARLDDDAIGYVEKYRLNPLDKAFDDLRERRLFDFGAGEIRTLRIAWPEASGTTEVALARDDAGDWQLGAPVQGRADQQTLRDLLSDLSFLRARSFVDAPTDEVRALLEEPLVTLYWSGDADHLERSARIGGVFEGGRLIEAANGRIFTIDPARVEDFPRSVSAYRDKTLASLDVSDARGLTLELASEQPDGAPLRVEATLGDGGWESAEPAIDAARAAEVVRALSSLRATDIAADEMGEAELASLGLAPPRARIRVLDGPPDASDAEILADVSLGRLDAERGLFAQRAGDTIVYVLPASAADELPLSREAFERDFAEGSADDAGMVEDADAEAESAADPLEGIDLP